MARLAAGMVLLVACPRCGHRGMRVEADETRDLTCLACSHTLPGTGVPLLRPAKSRPAAEAVA